MANEEESYHHLVAAWNEAHAASDQSLTVRHLARHNGHCTAWLEASRMTSATWKLVCDHHLEQATFNPWSYPDPDCPLHDLVRLWRQVELHLELMADPVVTAAHQHAFDMYAGPRLILTAVLQRMAHFEFVGTISLHLSHEDIQRLCFGRLTPDFDVEALLDGINPEFYAWYEKDLLSPQAFGPITQLARIGNPKE